MFRNRSWRVFLSVIIGLIAGEAILRLMGGVVLSDNLTFIPDRSSDQFVILCVGDSFTKGIGAKTTDSYPAQLQRMFDEKHPEWRVRVIKKGFPGLNTSQLAARFKDDLNSIRPDMVVLLAGGANRWNPAGYRSFKEDARFGSKFYDRLIDEVRVVGLLSGIINGFKNNSFSTKSHIPGPDKGEDNGKVKAIKDRAAICQSELGRYEEAIAWYKKILRININDQAALCSLAKVYWSQGKREEALKVFRFSIRLHGSNSKCISDFVLRSVGPASSFNQENIDSIRALLRDKPVFADHLSALQDLGGYMRSIEEQIEYDLTRMIRICERMGVSVLLMNYPDHMGWACQINAALEMIAEMNSKPFVDNDALLDDAITSTDDKRAYFYVDKIICNAKGYSLIARNVYGAILARNLIGNKGL